MKATNVVLRNSTILKICVAIACSLALCTGAAQTASAELIFKIQDVTVHANGVSPTQRRSSRCPAANRFSSHDSAEQPHVGQCRIPADQSRRAASLLAPPRAK